MDIQNAILTVPHDHYIFCRTIDRWEHFGNILKAKPPLTCVRGGFCTRSRTVNTSGHCQTSFDDC